MENADDMLSAALADKVGEMETRLRDSYDQAITAGAFCLGFMRSIDRDPKLSKDPIAMALRSVVNKQYESWVRQADGIKTMLELLGVKV